MPNGNESDKRHKEHWMNYILPIALIAGLVALLDVISDLPSGELQPIIPAETWLTTVMGYLIIATVIAAAFVIGVGVIRSLVRPFSPSPSRNLIPLTNSTTSPSVLANRPEAPV